MRFNLHEHLPKRFQIENKVLGMFTAVGMVYGWMAVVLFCTALAACTRGGFFIGDAIGGSILPSMSVGIPVGFLAGLAAGTFRRVTILWVPIGILAGSLGSVTYYKVLVIFSTGAPHNVAGVMVVLLPTVLGYGIMTAARADYHGRRRLPLIKYLWRVEHDAE